MIIKDVLSKLIDESSQKLKKENERNADRSQLCQGSIEHMIRLIDRTKHDLRLLKAITESVGGFCSAYPKRCLEEMDLFKTILLMELKNDH